MRVVIEKSLARGRVSAPPSKSMAHRLLIAAAYADRVVLYNSSLEEVGVLEDAAGIEKVLACADRSVIIVSGGGATRYQF